MSPKIQARNKCIKAIEKLCKKTSANPEIALKAFPCHLYNSTKDDFQRMEKFILACIPED